MSELTRGGLGLVFVLGVLVPGAGCGGEETPPHLTYPEAKVKLDGVVWPDYGPWPPADLNKQPLPDLRGPDGGPPPDGAADAGTGDGSPTPSCPGPSAAKCAAACAADEVCTEAKGGTCVKQVVLSGAATDKAVLKEVALAYVNCFAKAPSADTLCYTFNTCALTGSLTDAGVCDWVCNKSGVSDFPSSTVSASAKSICGCGWTDKKRPDWKIGSIIPGKKGVVCLGYDVVSWWYDLLNVNDCQYWPPT
jgi:hypothetical protein